IAELASAWMDPTPATTPIAAAPLEVLDGRPASLNQRALWFLDRLSSGGRAYHLARAFRVSGPLDAAALRRSILTLISRHSSLRAVFHERDGELFRGTVSTEDASFFEIHAADPASDVLADRLSAELARGFELETGPLFRVTVFHASPGEHVVCFAIHHIII